VSVTSPPRSLCCRARVRVRASGRYPCTWRFSSSSSGRATGGLRLTRTRGAAPRRARSAHREHALQLAQDDTPPCRPPGGSGDSRDELRGRRPPGSISLRAVLRRVMRDAVVPVDYEVRLAELHPRRSAGGSRPLGDRRCQRDNAVGSRLNSWRGRKNSRAGRERRGRRVSFGIADVVVDRDSPDTPWSSALGANGFMAPLDVRRARAGRRSSAIAIASIVRLRRGFRRATCRRYSSRLSGLWSGTRAASAAPPRPARAG
jgi:hypothetical protein